MLIPNIRTIPQIKLTSTINNIYKTYLKSRNRSIYII